MAKKSSNDEVYRGERWRVMWMVKSKKRSMMMNLKQNNIISQ